MAQYQYPILSVEDLVQFFRDLNYNIREEDIKKPDPQCMHDIYGHILELAANVPAEQVKQLFIHDAQQFDYPELHEESLPLTLFTLALQRMMSACGVHDFCLRDIIDPNPKRCIKIMSAAINFIRFKEVRMEILKAIKDKNEQFKEQHDYLLKANSDLSQKIKHLQAAQAEQEPQIKAVQEEIEVEANHLAEYHKLQASEQKVINEIKKQISEKKAERDQLKVKLLNGQKEGQKLSQKIVQSPERVKKEQDSMKTKVLSLKDVLDEKRNRTTQLLAETDRYKLLEDHVDKAHRLLQGIQQTVDKENEVHREIRAINDKIQEQTNLIGECRLKQDQLRTMQVTRQEKLEKLKLQHQAKMNSVNEQHGQLQKQKEVFFQKINQEDVEVNSLLQQKNMLLEEDRARELELEQKKDTLQNIYSEITVKVDQMHLDIGKKWEEFLRVMSEKPY